MSTDINVDALYQKMEHEIHCGTPFGEQFIPATDNFIHLYRRVGNQTRSDQGASYSWVDKFSRRTASVPALVKLKIAAVMRGNSDFSFKYRPSHVIYGEHCMVLSKRAFHIPVDETQPIKEISHRHYSKDPRKNHVMVWELAFGPDSDSAARPVALWFNIDQDKVAECKLTEAKRYRWKRGLKNSKEKRARSPFDHLDQFQMVRPHDKDAFDLTTDMLQNRLRMLQAEKTADLKERQEELARARQEKEQLHQRFEALLKHWVAWGFPINKGRAKVDKKTPEPPVDGMYELPLDSLARADSEADMTIRELSDDEENMTGSKAHRVWQSFVQCKVRAPIIGQASYSTMSIRLLVSHPCPLRQSFFQETESEEKNPLPEAAPNYRRLSVFAHLAQGKEIAEDRSLPHIHRDSPYYQKQENLGIVPSLQSDRCWKALLLPRNGWGFVNDWDLVREHFENSRTQKVLSIVQQK